MWKVNFSCASGWQGSPSASWVRRKMCPKVSCSCSSSGSGTVDSSKSSLAQLIASFQAFVFGFSVEVVMPSRAVFILRILIGVKGQTILESVRSVSVVDVQMIANWSFVFKIDAKNLAVSHLAMSAAGEVWRLKPWISVESLGQTPGDSRIVNEHNHIKTRVL